MNTNQDYKNRALEALSGKWDKAVIATLIIFVIFGGVGTAVSLPFGSDIESPTYLQGQGLSGLWSLLCVPLGWGLSIFFQRIARNEALDYAQLFDGYRGWNQFLRILLTLVLREIFATLWTLLLIIPGIIKSYSYSMTEYILRDEPELKYNAAIERSMEMMQGHKADLFWLDLSFIGWFILSILTLGFGFLLLIPYMETAHAKFYEDLKSNL